MSLYKYVMMVYVENFKKSIKETLVFNEFSKVERFKINKQTNKKINCISILGYKETKFIILLTIIRNMKYLGMKIKKHTELICWKLPSTNEGNQRISK